MICRSSRVGQTPSNLLRLGPWRLAAFSGNSQFHNEAYQSNNPHHTQTSWRVNLCNLRTAYSGSKLVEYVVVTLCGVLNIMCTQITLPKWWVNSASKVHHHTLVTRHLRHDPPIVVRWIWWRWYHLRVMLCSTVDQCSKGRRIGPSCVTLRSWRDFCGKETRSVRKAANSLYFIHWHSISSCHGISWHNIPSDDSISLHIILSMPWMPI